MTAFDIPYQAQTDAKKLCGAAALCMIYETLGTGLTQADVWPAISSRGARGRDCARTYLLARDALDRGYCALVLRAREGLPSLERCVRRSVFVILNHRIQKDRQDGHYSVLVEYGLDYVLLHDPLLGPSRRLSHQDLEELWTSKLGSEIAGHVFVAVAKRGLPAEACTQCGTVIPTTVLCTGCKEKILLEPAAALGCIAHDCPERSWQRIYCPKCDTPALPGFPETAWTAWPWQPIVVPEPAPPRLEPLREAVRRVVAAYGPEKTAVPYAGFDEQLNHIIQKLADVEATLRRQRAV